jgi:uncharacterized protein (DUF58 family)
MVPSWRVYLILGLVTIVGTLGATFGAQVQIAGWLDVVIVLALVVDIGVLGMAWWDAQQVNTHRVQITRQVDSKLSIGRENLVKLVVKTGDRPAVLQIRDSYPAEFVATPSHVALSLPANTTEVLTYTVFPSHRGEYRWGRVYVRQLGLRGFAWSTYSIALDETVAVYPDLIGLRSLTIRLTLEMSGNLRRIRRLGTGTEFAELREYSTGDDPRFIDWKATARRGHPLIRVLEPEQEQTLIILLDRGRLMTAQIQGLARFDWGLNATLSLALTGLHRGDRVGVGVFDRQMHSWTPPDRGHPHLATLIERLTPLHPVLLEPDYLSAMTKAINQQTRRALVVLITDIVDRTASAELLTAISRLVPRYLPFCVTLRDPNIDKQASQVSETVEAGYTRAVALDLMTQRQIALATLKQKGILILDAPANQISDQLVDRYLQLKAHNQI